MKGTGMGFFFKRKPPTMRIRRGTEIDFVSFGEPYLSDGGSVMLPLSYHTPLRQADTVRVVREVGVRAYRDEEHARNDPFSPMTLTREYFSVFNFRIKDYGGLEAGDDGTIEVGEDVLGKRIGHIIVGPIIFADKLNR